MNFHRVKMQANIPNSAAPIHHEIRRTPIRYDATQTRTMDMELFRGSKALS